MYEPCEDCLVDEECEYWVEYYDKDDSYYLCGHCFICSNEWEDKIIFGKNLSESQRKGKVSKLITETRSDKILINKKRRW